LQLLENLQHDDTTPDAGLSTNLMLSTEFPVFNRNQGNIQAAHAELVRAKQDYTAIQNRLMSEVAERFGRYQTGRAVSASYRTEIVPDQVRAYRGIYNNFLIDGQLVDFTGVVNAQQTLGNVIEDYTRSLDEEWTAAVDLAEILQVSDLLTMDGAAKPAAP
ncbi:MAG: TolC family protein, partial [Planctomycetaceae bacterium]